MYEKIKERYLKHYVRDDQLARYVALGVISQEQADEIIKMAKNTGGGGAKYRKKFRVRFSIPARLEVQIYEG